MTGQPTAADVLRVHTRVDSTSCICGWRGGLWQTHARHAADMLAAAGLLVTPEHDRDVRREGYWTALGDVRSGAFISGPAHDALAEHDAQVAARALREAAFAVRHSWDGSWNLRDPEDPEVFHSVDRWIERLADLIERGEAT